MILISRHLGKHVLLGLSIPHMSLGVRVRTTPRAFRALRSICEVCCNNLEDNLPRLDLRLQRDLRERLLFKRLYKAFSIEKKYRHKNTKKSKEQRSASEFFFSSNWAWCYRISRHPNHQLRTPTTFHHCLRSHKSKKKTELSLFSTPVTCFQRVVISFYLL